MEIELTIERLAYGGDGIGYLDGKVCFVQGALPGEKVRARVLQQKKKFIKAMTTKVLLPSPARLEPPCAYYGECGGCQYQHVEYAEELKWKEIQVRESLVRALKIEEDQVKPIIGSEKDYHYRQRLTLHETIKKSPHSQVFGFVSNNNRSVIPIEDCLLGDQKLKEIFGKKILLKKGEKQISYQLSEKGNVFSDRSEKLFGVTIGTESVITSAKSFFQNNLDITHKIARQVDEWIDVLKPKTFIDLYSGVGTFSFITKAKFCDELIFAEENPHSLEALKENLRERKLGAVVLEGSVERTFTKFLEKSSMNDALVFLDPPRKGLNGSFAQFLSGQAQFSGIIYLSCHFGALGRDIEVILSQGCYQIDEIIPFDMFPRTKHVEVAVFLKRK